MELEPLIQRMVLDAQQWIGQAQMVTDAMAAMNLAAEASGIKTAIDNLNAEYAALTQLERGLTRVIELTERFQQVQARMGDFIPAMSAAGRAQATASTPSGSMIAGMSLAGAGVGSGTITPVTPMMAALSGMGGAPGMRAVNMIAGMSGVGNGLPPNNPVNPMAAAMAAAAGNPSALIAGMSSAGAGVGAGVATPIDPMMALLSGSGGAAFQRPTDMIAGMSSVRKAQADQLAQSLAAATRAATPAEMKILASAIGAARGLDLGSQLSSPLTTGMIPGGGSFTAGPTANAQKWANFFGIAPQMGAPDPRYLQYRINQAQEAYLKTLPEAREAPQGAMSSMLGRLGTGFMAFREFRMGLDEMVAGIKTTITGFSTGFNQATSGMVTGTRDIVRGFLGGFSESLSGLMSGHAGATVGGVVGGVGKGLGGILGGGAAGLQGLIQGLTTTLSEAVQGFGKMMSGGIMLAGAGIAAGLAATGVGGPLGGVAIVVSWAVAKIVEAVSDTLGGIVGAIGKAIATVVGGVLGIAGDVVKTAFETGSKVIGTTVDIGMGVQKSRAEAFGIQPGAGAADAYVQWTRLSEVVDRTSKAMAETFVQSSGLAGVFAAVANMLEGSFGKLQSFAEFAGKLFGQLMKQGGNLAIAAYQALGIGGMTAGNFDPAEFARGAGEMVVNVFESVAKVGASLVDMLASAVEIVAEIVSAFRIFYNRLKNNSGMVATSFILGGPVGGAAFLGGMLQSSIEEASAGSILGRGGMAAVRAGHAAPGVIDRFTKSLRDQFLKANQTDWMDAVANAPTGPLAQYTAGRNNLSATARALFDSVMGKTGTPPFVTPESGLFHEGTGVTPMEIFQKQMGHLNEIARQRIPGFGPREQAVGAMEIYDKLRSTVGHLSDYAEHLAPASMFGSSEAADTIAKAQIESNTVQEEIVKNIIIGNEISRHMEDRMTEVSTFLQQNHILVKEVGPQ